jgi:hypothetical protein
MYEALGLILSHTHTSEKSQQQITLSLLEHGPYRAVSLWPLFMLEHSQFLQTHASNTVLTFPLDSQLGESFS